MQIITHRHYFDYGYSERQCIECNDLADNCPYDAVTVDNTIGCMDANRYPQGLPGTHPAFIHWANENGL